MYPVRTVPRLLEKASGVLLYTRSDFRYPFPVHIGLCLFSFRSVPPNINEPRAIAQLVARLVWDQEVEGSIPSGPTKKVATFVATFFVGQSTPTIWRA